MEESKTIIGEELSEVNALTQSSQKMVEIVFIRDLNEVFVFKASEASREKILDGEQEQFFFEILQEGIQSGFPLSNVSQKYSFPIERNGRIFRVIKPKKSSVKCSYVEEIPKWRHLQELYSIEEME